MKKTGTILGIILGSVGVGLIGLGGILFIRELLFLQRAVVATAVVAENKLYTYTGQVNEYGVQHYYCAEFQFQTQAGQQVRFEEASCAELDSPPQYQVGQTVAVVYDPRTPGSSVQMRSDSFSNAIAAVGFGVVALLAGLALFWFGWWMGRRARSRVVQR